MDQVLTIAVKTLGIFLFGSFIPDPELNSESFSISHQRTSGKQGNTEINSAALISSAAFCSQKIVKLRHYPELNESIKRGKEVYALYCQDCHMEDGKGTPEINPPVAKADYLKNPAKALIAVILEGQSGEVVVNGEKYNTIMPAREYLTDVEIADVLNYTRNSWGNKIQGTITPAMIKAMRK